MSPSNDQSRGPVASTAHLCFMLVLLACFPIVLRLTGALNVLGTSPEAPGHTGAIVRFCAVITFYLWTLCVVVWMGVRSNRTRLSLLLGTSQVKQAGVLKTTLATVVSFVGLLLVGSASNFLVFRGGIGSQTTRGLDVRNIVEALAFLTVASTAGFAEELVFRGYLQQQFYARTGSILVASTLQIAIFTLGHIYQGGLRLIAVALEGLVLTLTALWRKSLVPGMVAHSVGDGLMSIVFLTRLVLK